MSGTEIGYAATRSTRMTSGTVSGCKVVISLRACYAKSGTEIAYGPVRCAVLRSRMVGRLAMGCA
eukprot:1990945-Rhodomonas_salina.2